jgi:hypothetical protein
MKKNKEIRVLPLEVEMRQMEDDTAMVEWYPAVFNSFSEDLGGFREIITPGAFQNALKSSDVRALINHDSNMVLGRAKAGTLTLIEDDNGLRASVKMPNTTYANNLRESIQRGDIDQGSFGFTLEERGQKWEKDEEGRVVRTISEVRELLDVSLVTYPAYPDTSVAKRQMEEKTKLSKEDIQEYFINKQGLKTQLARKKANKHELESTL